MVFPSAALPERSEAGVPRIGESVFE